MGRESSSSEYEGSYQGKRLSKQGKHHQNRALALDRVEALLERLTKLAVWTLSRGEEKTQNSAPRAGIVIGLWAKNTNTFQYIIQEDGHVLTNEIMPRRGAQICKTSKGDDIQMPRSATEL